MSPGCWGVPSVSTASCPLTTRRRWWSLTSSAWSKPNLTDQEEGLIGVRCMVWCPCSLAAELPLCQGRYAGRSESIARLQTDVVREPEPREQLRTDEGGHLVDSLCAQREHGHAARLEDLPLVVPAIVAERQLSVRPRRDDAPAHVGRQHVVGQEGADRLAPAEPGGPRRHRERAVGGEHLDDGVDVGALEGVDVAVDELAQVPIVQRPQHRLLAALGQALVDRPVSALQRAVDRWRARLEHLGRLARRETEHVAQDEHRALARRQMLERRDERELDALALLIAGVEAGQAVLETEC